MGGVESIRVQPETRRPRVRWQPCPSWAGYWGMGLDAHWNRWSLWRSAIAVGKHRCAKRANRNGPRPPREPQRVLTELPTAVRQPACYGRSAVCLRNLCPVARQVSSQLTAKNRPVDQLSGIRQQSATTGHLRCCRNAYLWTSPDGRFTASKLKLALPRLGHEESFRQWKVESSEHQLTDLEPATHAIEPRTAHPGFPFDQ